MGSLSPQERAAMRWVARETSPDARFLVIAGTPWEIDRNSDDALNRGVRAASGEVFTCLGADDALAPGALSAVADWFTHRGSPWVVGGCQWINAEDRSIGVMRQPPRWIPRRMFASLGWTVFHSHRRI
jgi:glycosyl transferase family 2